MIQIIPAIDIIGGKCVRLTKGDYSRQTTYDSDPVDMVKRYVDSGLTRIHAVDLSGAKAGQPQELNTLEKMALVNGAQIEWGGGIKNETHLHRALNAGAEWIVVGSVAVKNPELFDQWLLAYGGSKMILGADVRDGKVAVSGWMEESTLSVSDLINRFTVGAPHKFDDPLSQVIATEISKDGMLQGPAFELYRTLMEKFPSMLFTASGGISSLADILELNRIGVPRVIVGKAIYEGRVTLKELEDLCLHGE